MTVGAALGRIMVVVTDDPTSRLAVQLAAELGASGAGEVLVVHLLARDAPCCGPSAFDSGLRADSGALERALAQFREAGVRHRVEELRTLDDHVVEAVLQSADEYGATLLVIGDDRRPGLAGRLRRGLGARIAAAAARPVLLAR